MTRNSYPLEPMPFAYCSLVFYSTQHISFASGSRILVCPLVPFRGNLVSESRDLFVSVCVFNTTDHKKITIWRSGRHVGDQGQRIFGRRLREAASVWSRVHRTSPTKRRTASQRSHCRCYSRNHDGYTRNNNNNNHHGSIIIQQRHGV